MSWEEMGAPMLRMRMKQLRISKPESRKPTPGKTLNAGLVIDELEPEAGEIVFEKFLPNAFLGTCFEWWLRKYSLKTIVLAGASLETGIDGTAREALNRGYYTVIARDCVGSQFQDTYTAALLSLERIFDIVDSSDIIHEWQNTVPRC
jgi:nicotinamidase-related amidase